MKNRTGPLYAKRAFETNIISDDLKDRV